MNRAAFRSLSRAMFLGFVRDRSALVFSILIPVIFLLLLGSIYKGSASTPKISVLEVGRVTLLDQARRGSPQLQKILDVTRASSLPAALADVRQGTGAAAGQQQGTRIIAHSPAAAPPPAGVVNSVFSSVVSQANIAVTGRPATYQLAALQVEDKSLKPIQYLAPGLLG